MTENIEHAPLPHVRDVLALPEVQSGGPELVAGGGGQDREVRWAHVFAGSVVTGLLDGGELILTTGAGWPQEEGALAALAEALVSVGGTGARGGSGREGGSGRPEGVAAILLELGKNFTAPPPALIRSCDAAGVPLIVLHEEVRFVQITQRVHQRILAAQTEALQARTEVHAMLTELGLNRSPVDYVVEQLAETLGAPVVLEDPFRRVVAFAGAGSQLPHVLAPWANAHASGAQRLAPWAPAPTPHADPAERHAPARGAGSSEQRADPARDAETPELPAGYERVPVEARGTRWGTLTALPGPPHPAGRRTVLELGAFALALGRLADSEGEQWLQLGSKRVFETLLGGRYRTDAELATQLSAAGLPLEGRTVFAATLRGVEDFGAHPSLERAIIETALRRAVAPQGRVLLAPDNADAAEDPEGSRALLALISLPGTGAGAGPGERERASGADAADSAVPAIAVRLAHELDMLVPGPTPAAWRTHLALGAPERRLRQLVASLEQLRVVGRLAASAEVGRVTVQQVERQPLAHLIRGLAGRPELQQFADDALGPLVEHDATAGPGHSGDLLRVLSAYLANPSNRSLAANRARLSRSVFYQRLTLIEDLLGVDLADGETIATLTVALLARQR